MSNPTGSALVNSQAVIESFSLSPGGDRAAYAVRRVVAGRYRSHLWLVAWDGGRPRRLTSGPVRDTTPIISPDGKQVAFARAPAGEAAEGAEGQIWVLPLAGGEPWQLTRLPHGAGTPLWSPDGRRIAFLAPAGPHRFAVGPEKPGKPLRARRITRTDFRDDESGFLSRRTHLFSVAARRVARPRQLTRGDFDVAQPAWSPDGRLVAFVADMGSDWNLMPRAQIHGVASAGGELRSLASLNGDATRPAFSPDGSLLAFIGSDVEDPPDDTIARLWVVRVAGGEPRCLTPDLDRSVENGAWADLVMADDEPGPLWLDEESLLVLVGDRGRNVPHVVTLGGAVRPILDPDRLVGAGVEAAGGAHDGRVWLSAGIDRHAAELYAVEGWQTGSGHLRRLTTAGSGWQDRFPLPRWDETWIDGPGGAIQTWIVSPADAGDGPLPTIVILHGGPTGAHAPGGTMDSTMLAGHGYRLVLPNIRGSDTFGSAWIGALGGRWGDVDAQDVHAVLDEMVARGLVDPDRLGVMGLSYGGYLAQWLVGASDRFRAAVAENGVTNQVSAWGNSYFGVHYNRRARLGDPLTQEGMLRIWSHSPLRIANDMHTPLLMLQAEEDRICPPADNEQLFTALKVLGREIEYILYPEEFHEMKNYGRPDRRIDRMERILAWFDRWLTPINRKAVRRRATSGSADRPARRR